jgi:hypothetical protein
MAARIHGRDLVVQPGRCESGRRRTQLHGHGGRGAYQSSS